MAATLQPPQFSCRTEYLGPHAVIVPQGELDLATVAHLKSKQDEVLARGTTSIVVDLSQLTFIDSTGLHALWTLARRAKTDGFRLELLPGQPAVMRLFELTDALGALPFGNPR